MNEKLLEIKVKHEVKSLGGKALKFLSNYWVGAPDRIILLPGGKTCFVEVKSTGEKLRPVQKTRRKELEKLGFKVYVVDSEESLNRFINEVSGLEV